MGGTEDSITLREAARRTGLAPVTLRQAARSGRLQAVRIGEGRRSIFLVSPADLERYLAGRKTWRGHRGKQGRG
jgi:excisionase family DNA binding protein